MASQIKILRLPDGSLGIGFLTTRLLIVVVPSAVQDVLDAVLGGNCSDRASLDQIPEGPHKGRWTLTILATRFRMDEGDVTALRTELRREFSH